MSDLMAFASIPATAMVQISTANTARDGTGTLGTLITAPTAGTRVDDIEISATGSTSSGVVRMFVYDGTNTRFIREWLVSGTITPSATVSPFNLQLKNQAIILKSGWSLKFSTHNSETYNIFATRAGDYT